MAVIAGISYEAGQELIHIQSDAVDRNDFALYVKELHDKQNGQKIVLFLDNLSVHHTDVVKEVCKDLDIKLIFNMPYSPDTNPIESTFSVVKNAYKRARMNLEIQ